MMRPVAWEACVEICSIVKTRSATASVLRINRLCAFFSHVASPSAINAPWMQATCFAAVVFSVDACSPRVMSLHYRNSILVMNALKLAHPVMSVLVGTRQALLSGRWTYWLQAAEWLTSG